MVLCYPVNREQKEVLFAVQINVWVPEPFEKLFRYIVIYEKKYGSLQI